MRGNTSWRAASGIEETSSKESSIKEDNSTILVEIAEMVEGIVTSNADLRASSLQIQPSSCFESREMEFEEQEDFVLQESSEDSNSSNLISEVSENEDSVENFQTSLATVFKETNMSHE